MQILKTTVIKIKCRFLYKGNGILFFKVFINGIMLLR